MDHITPGHWIFALLFVLVFIGCLVWAYRKDINLHRLYYRGSYIVLLVILIGVILLYLIRDKLN